MSRHVTSMHGRQVPEVSALGLPRLGARQGSRCTALQPLLKSDSAVCSGTRHTFSGILQVPCVRPCHVSQALHVLTHPSAALCLTLQHVLQGRFTRAQRQL